MSPFCAKPGVRRRVVIFCTHTPSSPSSRGPRSASRKLAGLVPGSVQLAFARQDAKERGERDDIQPLNRHLDRNHPASNLCARTACAAPGFMVSAILAERTSRLVDAALGESRYCQSVGGHHSFFIITISGHRPIQDTGWKEHDCSCTRKPCHRLRYEEAGCS